MDLFFSCEFELGLFLQDLALVENGVGSTFDFYCKVQFNLALESNHNLDLYTMLTLNINNIGGVV